MTTTPGPTGPMHGPTTGPTTGQEHQAGDTTVRPTMRAVLQDRYGTPDTLAVRVVPRPEIAPDEVLLEVHAAGVDRGVWHLVTGLPYLIRVAGFGVRKPKNPVVGLDVAGRVVAVGSEVTRFVPGEEVFGIARGAYAEYAAAGADKLSHKPAGVSFEQAAVAAISGITALQALTDIGGLTPGQRVLVVGASGGVGTFAVQLAKHLGGHVTGVASTAKLDLVRSLGADEVIDYTVDDFTDGASRYDLILDIGGRTSVRRLRRALTPHGTLVIVGGEDADRWIGGVGRQVRAMVLSPFVRQRLTTFISKEQASSIDVLASTMESGDVVPQIGARFSLDQVPEALNRLTSGGTRGKSVIRVRA